MLIAFINDIKEQPSAQCSACHADVDIDKLEQQLVLADDKQRLALEMFDKGT
jgi:nitrate/TMAO reductase-like tetraheme cytochrome c subunit